MEQKTTIGSENTDSENTSDGQKVNRRSILKVAAATTALFALGGVTKAAELVENQNAKDEILDPRTAHPQKLSFKQQQWPALQRNMDPKPDCGEISYVGSGRLKGYKALITGADSGIGRAVAIAYAKEGADIALNYLPEEEADAQDVIAVIRKAGSKAVAIPGDLRSEEFCRSLITTANKQLGGIDILVSNAGFSKLNPDILLHSSAHWDQTIKTNLYAPFWLSKAIVPILKPGASIIFTASVVANKATPSFLDYGASKAGLVNLAKGLAAQLGSKGIRVNAVAPGAIFTPLMTYSGGDDSKLTKMITPLGRVGQPVELASIFVGLAENNATYVSGSVWSANGGEGYF